MPGMMYVGSMAFIEKNGQILIARRHPNHPNGDGGLWEMPSGRLEVGESFEQGLKREVKEETTIEVKVIAPVATWCLPNRPLVGVAFACEYLSGDVKLTSEHTEHKWVEVDELLKYMNKPSMVDNIERYIEWRKCKKRLKLVD